MSKIIRQIGTFEDVFQGENIPQMVVISPTELEEVGNGVYIHKSSGASFYIKENRFLVCEINGFKYITIQINPYTDEKAKKFCDSSYIYQMNDKLGFVLSSINKDKISTGLTVEDNNGNILNVTGWRNEYDGDSFLSGIECEKNGKTMILPILYYGAYDYELPSCDEEIKSNLCSSRKK